MTAETLFFYVLCVLCGFLLGAGLESAETKKLSKKIEKLEHIIAALHEDNQDHSNEYLEKQVEIDSLQNQLEERGEIFILQREKIVTQREELEKAARIMQDYKWIINILGQAVGHVAPGAFTDFFAVWNETEIAAAKFIHDYKVGTG